QSAASPVEDTDAADWTAVIDTPVVTDDLLPDLEPAEPALTEPEPAEPEEDDEGATGEPEAAEPSIPTPGDGNFDLPDWHTLTSLPAVEEPGGSEAQEPLATQDERKGRTPMRSEEHTSELQSRFDLVCRLLLEKKNRTR